MRGEYCIAGASVFSFISVVLMVFAIIGQVNPTSLPKSIYMVKLDVAAYGAGLQNAMKSAPNGLYMTNGSAPLGKNTGLRQEYRWGLLNSCGYAKEGGACNSTRFPVEFQPLKTILSDTPMKFFIQTNDIIPDEAEKFRSESFNGNLSKVGFVLMIVGAAAAAVALIFGVIPNRLTFAVSTVMSIIATLTLLIGAAIWTAIISGDSFINKVQVEGKKPLGITISAGPALYLTWVAFAFSLLSVVPYLISCCTYRRN